jgi:hypothetical protein
MLRAFISQRIQAFPIWWKAPATGKDRFFGAVVGAMAGFWIGVLASVVFVAPPVSFTMLGLWALCAAMLGLVLGVVFPKATMLLLFPVSTFGAG